MLKVIAYTVGRSDFERFLPMLNALNSNRKINLKIVASYIHYLSYFGSTIKLVRKNFNLIALNKNKRDIKPQDSPKNLSNKVGLEVHKLSKIFYKEKPDLIFVLGDRYEMISAPIAAVPFNIPIVHLYGGAVTEGAIDDVVRHSITKMSNFHLVAHEEYKRRIKQMGEEKWRIKNIGIPEISLMKKQEQKTEKETSKIIGLDLKKQTILVTYHPVTLEISQLKKQIKSIIKTLKEINKQVIFTYPNSDVGFREIVKNFKLMSKKSKKVKLIKNAGLNLYVNLMRHCDVMLGNSSSGIVEAASFKMPVVNLGTRQKGKIKPLNVIDSNFNGKSMKKALKIALSQKFKKKIRKIKNPYEKKINLNKLVNDIIFYTRKKNFIKKKFINVE